MRRALAALGALTVAGALALAAAPVAPAQPTATPSRVIDFETVEADLEPDGRVDEVRLVDSLRIVGRGTVVVTDPTSTEGFRVLSGFERPAMGDGEVTWSVRGLEDAASFVTSSELDRDPPLGLVVTYRLDGRPIEAEDLVGRSGRVRIGFEVSNRTAALRPLGYRDADGDRRTFRASVAIPMVARLQVELPGSRFTDVRAEGASLVTGARGLVAAWDVILAPPLGDLEQARELVAEVRDFELGPVRLVGAPLAPADREDLGSTEDATEEDLQGARGLAEATEGLAAGMGDLLDGSRDLQAGMAQLLAGVQALSTGLTAAFAGSSALAEGLEGAAAGSGGITQGLEGLQGGLEGLRGGLERLTGSLPATQAGAESIADAVAALDAELASIRSALDGPDPSSVASLGQAIADACAAVAGCGASPIPGLASSVVSAADALGAAIGDPGSPGSVRGGVAAIGGSAGRLAESLGAAVQGAEDLADAAAGTFEAVDDLAEGSAELTEGLREATGGARGLAEGLAGTAAGSGALVAGMGSASGGVSAVIGGIEGQRRGLRGIARQASRTADDLARTLALMKAQDHRARTEALVYGPPTSDQAQVVVGGSGVVLTIDELDGRSEESLARIGWSAAILAALVAIGALLRRRAPPTGSS